MGRYGLAPMLKIVIDVRPYSCITLEKESRWLYQSVGCRRYHKFDSLDYHIVLMDNFCKTPNYCDAYLSSAKADGA